MFKRFINKILFPHTYSSEAFVDFLRKKGCQIGENTYFFNPKDTHIDINRADYITIGSNCKITAGVSIIAHDYSWENLRYYCNEILPSGGKKIVIGNNVFLGIRSILLRGVTIGDNVIVGAGSVVTKDLPSNTICAGNPAKVIGTMDEYSNKLEQNLLENSLYEAKVFYQKNHRFPKLEELNHFMVICLPRTEENWEKYISRVTFKGDKIEEVKKAFMNTKPRFSNYEELLEYMKNEIEEK